MRLQRAALREGFLAQIALVGPNAGVRSRVPLQVEGVVESFAAERAQVPLHVRVAFHVTVQQALESEMLGADAADEFSVFLLRRRRRRRGRLLLHRNVLFVLPQTTGNVLHRQRIFNPVPAVHELQLNFGWKAQLEMTQIRLVSLRNGDVINNKTKSLSDNISKFN